ncbi:ATP-binding protein [Nocardioides sp.]|uniref:ATP-binding protein n=1 Tax=Nocardioides sp. TaxID=35761 RepID=UPI002B26D846|nr:ATP-binding protein [Nocardioides sp.]
MRKLEAQLMHDMRNAAMVLHEGAEQLRVGREVLTPEAVEHLCLVLERRSQMLVRLLDDLGTSHLADRGSLELARRAVPLIEVCEQSLAGRPVPEGVTVSLDVSPELVVLADPLRLAQVVDNLLGNALRYGGSSVGVTAVRDAGSIRLSVTDDGPGVPEELHPNLFEGYSRGDSSSGFGGSGLGLMIVRQLAEAMGGSATHDQHHGTRFTVTVPALPVTQHTLLPDQAVHGHSVIFWSDDSSGSDPLVAGLASYAAHGLVRGEAVVMAVTPPRLARVASALADLGIDPDAVQATGQYVPIDAESLDRALLRDGHIDTARFQRLVGDRARALSASRPSLRIYGEVVDRYWRRGDGHLALELESAWAALRAQVDFPLLCAYELAPGQTDHVLRLCHEAVVENGVDAA